MTDLRSKSVTSPFMTRTHSGPVTTSSPWGLCEEPQRWQDFGPGWGGMEVEVLYYMIALTVMLKPQVIVESGTFTGNAAAALAMGCRQNGFGHVWTYEIDRPSSYSAQSFINAEGLGDWVTITCADSRSIVWPVSLPIDILLMDGGNNRSEELAAFEPHLSRRGVILCHDARERAHAWYTHTDRYDMVTFGTPTGLLIMQSKNTLYRGIHG